MNRLTREEYYFELAKVVAKRGTCKRAQVGAVLIHNGRIIGTGYNGSPSGEEHCLEVGCEIENGHCVRTIHAETNVIINAARHGVSTEGSTMYCTHKPCRACEKNIQNAGIVDVKYLIEYRSEDNDKK